MKEVLLINLTRMGDILQSTPIMRGLKRRFPGCSITYVVISGFAEICKGIPYIDRLIPFDMDDYYNKLHSIDPVENYRTLEDFIGRINERSYDLLINLTPSKSCALLTALIDAKRICGLTVDGEGYRVLKGPWMRYFTTSVFNRHLNPFNLVDMHARACGVGGDREGLVLKVPSDSEKRAREILEGEGVREGDLLIGLQPGASKEHKRWGTGNFGLLARRLCEEMGARVVVFGSRAEANLGREVKAIGGDGVIDLTGRTDLMELAALLRRCRLLVSNDSGTMHIATAVGTKVVELSLGAAYFRETGPYGEGHMVVESRIPCHPCNFDVDCKGMECRSYIRPDHVFEIVKMALEGREGPIQDGQEWRSVQVYRSAFDSMGLLDYIPLIERPMEERDILLRAYRRMWASLLEGGNPLEVLDDTFIRTPSIQASMEGLVLPFKRLGDLAEKGMALTRELKTLFREKRGEEMRAVGEKIAALDEEVTRMRFTHPWVSPVTNFFSYSKESLDGEGLEALIEGTEALYRFLRDQARVMESLLSGTPCLS